MRILGFDEFIKLNEGVKSVVTLGELLKVLQPFGWDYKIGKDNVSCKIYKDDFVVPFHLKHKGVGLNRILDVGGVDIIRNKLMDDFKKTGDPSEINAVPWEQWRLGNPFDREFIDYDSETGVKKSEIEELNKITVVEKVFKNVYVIQNEDGEYNLCKSEDDKKPLLDRWYPYYDTPKGLGYRKSLGYDEDCNGDFEDPRFGTHWFLIKDDGTIGKTKGVDYVKESKNIN